MHTFRIVFVPGLRPKPEDAVYREALLQCIAFGLERYRPEAARLLAESHESFQLYSWTFGVYGEHRDIGLDLAGIGALLAAPQPSEDECAEIDSWTRRLVRAAHRVGDLVPVLGRMFASPRQRMMLSEATNYLRDRGGVGERTRAGLADILLDSHNAQERLIVIGHSLGSVIAYDTLWELSQESAMRVDHFITIGSPLGTRFIRRLVRGAQESGAKRFPDNIRRWSNLAARGELTALYPRLRNAYGEMLELGLLERFDEYIDIYNHFVGARGLNVHSEYGYLIQPEFARTLAAAMSQSS